MRIQRTPGRPVLFLALILFGVWLCAGWLHEHPNASSCPICKELAANAVDLTPYQPAPEPPRSPEPIRWKAGEVTSEVFITLPHGRAPPVA